MSKNSNFNWFIFAKLSHDIQWCHLKAKRKTLASPNPSINVSKKYKIPMTFSPVPHLSALPADAAIIIKATPMPILIQKIILKVAVGS